MRDQDSTDLEAMQRPCIHPAGMIRLLRALSEREEEKAAPPRTWWQRIKDMWRSVK